MKRNEANIEQLTNEIQQAISTAIHHYRKDRLANEWEFRGYKPEIDAVESSLMLAKEKLNEVLEMIDKKKTLN